MTQSRPKKLSLDQVYILSSNCQQSSRSSCGRALTARQRLSRQRSKNRILFSTGISTLTY